VAWYERWYALQDDNFNISRKVNRRTNSISAAFDRICEVLHELGYLDLVNDEYEVTEHGRMLGRIYGELDLLAAQCLMHNIWSQLTEGNLAAAVSGLVYEARRDDAPGLPSINAIDLNEAVTLTISTWGNLKDVEHQHQVEMLREPDFGFLWPAYRWANGQSVARALRNSDLAPGDFVRWSKQVIDLLGQISAAALDPVVAQRARACAETMNRGIVAW
jgi:ATP-dependent RNA helicase HelY